jgi:hypothetical protein
MFSISNTIAYQQMMIHGGDPKPRGDLPTSQWFNVTGPARGHYEPAELEEARQLIDSLLAGSTERPLTSSDIIVISPFRDVANALSRLRRQFGPTCERALFRPPRATRQGWSFWCSVAIRDARARLTGRSACTSG